MDVPDRGQTIRWLRKARGHKAECRGLRFRASVYGLQKNIWEDVGSGDFGRLSASLEVPDAMSSMRRLKRRDVGLLVVYGQRPAN